MKLALEEVLDFVIKHQRANYIIGCLCRMETVPEYVVWGVWTYEQGEMVAQRAYFQFSSATASLVHYFKT